MVSNDAERRISRPEQLLVAAGRAPADAAAVELAATAPGVAGVLTGGSGLRDADARAARPEHTHAVTPASNTSLCCSSHLGSYYM